MNLSPSCPYCGYGFEDEARICPRCGALRGIVSPEIPSNKIDEDYLNDPKWRPVIEELRRKRKIQAIKEYRRITNVGLKEAKESVEKIQTHLGLR